MLARVTSGSGVSQSQGTQMLSGQAAQDVINDTNEISDAGASPLTSNAVMRSSVGII